LKNHGKLKSFFGDTHSEDAKKWLESLNVKFQMVFIDGDHTEHGIKLDTELVLPFLDDNAYVIYHDTVINFKGSDKFDRKLKNGLIKELKHEKDFISETAEKKGISVYRYAKE